ncbi:MAG: TorF family putative porin [Hyphomicrobium aestuarii]|nr:TorF family putative porin [Hyphomicrobium aestuarii]
MKNLVLGFVAAAAMVAGSTAALANEPPKFAWSFNIGGTNDYVFRGVAQRGEDPTVFGGVDFTYGMFYAGAWAANVDFGNAALGGVPGAGGNVATIEVDVYGGIKPTLGPVTFELGVIGYIYPGARDTLGVDGVREQDYAEIKGGASVAVPMLPALTVGGAVFYSPEYQGGQNEVITTEATAAYTFATIGKFTPSISGLLGAQYGDANDGFILANGQDDLLYWNVGLTLAVEKFSFDFRYHDTDISNANNFCTGQIFQCDERFVFTGKFTY